MKYFIPRNHDETDAQVAFTNMHAAREWATKYWGECEDDDFQPVDEIPEGFDLIEKRITTRDYHHDLRDFAEGQSVTYVDGGGGMHAGTIASIEGDFPDCVFSIEFDDGQAGSALPSECF